jgi:hypothetical protein
VVLVAMSGSTTYDSYKQAVDAIKFANGSVLGAVITKVPVSTGKYKHKKYGYGYGYGGYGYSYGYGGSSSSSSSSRRTKTKRA